MEGRSGMKKKKNNQVAQKPPKQDHGLNVGDLLDSSIAQKLKDLKKEKEQELIKEKEEERARQQFEAKQREKNKTFEELLNESTLDWKKYKS